MSLEERKFITCIISTKYVLCKFTKLCMLQTYDILIDYSTIYINENSGLIVIEYLSA